MFALMDIPFEYWIEHVNFGLFMSGLDSLPGYSIGEFQALPPVVLVVFGAVD